MDYEYHVVPDGIHWNIRDVLPYQRNFNFVNGPRSIGKTYSTLGFFIDRYLKTKNEQFVYLVRTKKEKDDRALKKALQKIIRNHFNDYDFTFTTENGYVRKNDECPWELFAWCIALSESQKIKPNSYPLICWGFLDEYMIEGNVNNVDYVDGWGEPERLLSIYHTIDRDEDRLKLFLMGNNTQFYNPYHIHPAFHIPMVKPGEIYKSKNVLFQRAVPSEALREKQRKSKFGQMIDGTEYAQYALDGQYFLDNESFIGKRPNSCTYFATIHYNGDSFAFWYDKNSNLLYADKRIQCVPTAYDIALTLADHTDNTRFVRERNDPCISTIRTYVSLGRIRYYNMAIKGKVEAFLPKIL